MGKFDGVLLASDFDDTYYSAAGEVAPANLEALAYFEAQGGRFTISTGRAHRTFAPLLHLTPVNAPVILANGAQLYDFDKEELLAEFTMPDTAAADLEELFVRQPELSAEAYHGEEVFIFNPNYWTWYHIKRAGVTPVECPISQMAQPWHKVILQHENEILLPAQADILSHWPDRYEAIFSNPHMLEVTAKGCTKGGTVLELARRLGIARENIYCVGDNQNDLPMLEISAIPFAPANCAKEVKDWGATILPPCEEGTIAAIIDILDKRY